MRNVVLLDGDLTGPLVGHTYVPGVFDTAKPGQPLTNSVPPVLPSAN